MRRASSLLFHPQLSYELVSFVPVVEVLGSVELLSKEAQGMISRYIVELLVDRLHKYQVDPSSPVTIPLPFLRRMCRRGSTLEEDVAFGISMRERTSATSVGVTGAVPKTKELGFTVCRGSMKQSEEALCNPSLILCPSPKVTGDVGYAGLTSLFVKGAPGVDRITLAGLPLLHSVELHGFVTVRKIENGFLSKTRKLTRVVMNGFSQVATIGDSFLAGNSSLSAVIGLEQSFEAVTSIGHSFLSGTAIMKVNIGSWGKLTSIDSGFLSLCQRLSSCILPGIRKGKLSLERIGPTAFAGSKGLTALKFESDISSSTASKSRGSLRIGWDFCAGCVTLQSLCDEKHVIGMPLQQPRSETRPIRTTRTGLVSGGTTQLRSTAASTFELIVSMESGFMDKAGLKEFTFAPFKQLVEFESDAFQSSEITSVDISGFRPSVIPSNFCAGSLLTSLAVTNVNWINSVDKGFLQGTRVVNLDFSTWTGVTSVGQACLADTSQLQSIDFSGWVKSIQSVGFEFLAGSSVTTVRLRAHRSKRASEAEPPGIGAGWQLISDRLPKRAQIVD